MSSASSSSNVNNSSTSSSSSSSTSTMTASSLEEWLSVLDLRWLISDGTPFRNNSSTTNTHNTNANASSSSNSTSFSASSSSSSSLPLVTALRDLKNIGFLDVHLREVAQTAELPKVTKLYTMHRSQADSASLPTSSTSNVSMSSSSSSSSASSSSSCVAALTRVEMSSDGVRWSWPLFRKCAALVFNAVVEQFLALNLLPAPKYSEEADSKNENDMRGTLDPMSAAHARRRQLLAVLFDMRETPFTLQRIAEILLYRPALRQHEDEAFKAASSSAAASSAPAAARPRGIYYSNVDRFLFAFSKVVVGISGSSGGTLREPQFELLPLLMKEQMDVDMLGAMGETAAMALPPQMMTMNGENGGGMSMWTGGMTFDGNHLNLPSTPFPSFFQTNHQQQQTHQTIGAHINDSDSAMETETTHK